MSAGLEDERDFVDTNILVYAYDRSAGYKYVTAVHLVQEWWENGNGCTSIQVLQEFYVTVTRKIAVALDYDNARRLISDLAHWRLHVPEANDVLEAIDFQQRYQLSFWDAMIIQSAAKLGCRRLFSEDLSHGGMYGQVLVINPFEKNGL
jgi:predicted nucleic acid-binding protein